MTAPRSRRLPIYCSPEPLVFPGGDARDTAVRPAELATLTQLATQPSEERRMFVAVQRDRTVTTPTLPDLYPIGVVATVTRISRRAKHNLEVELTGVARAQLIAIEATAPCHVAELLPIDASGALSDVRRHRFAVWLRDARPFYRPPPPRPAEMSDSDFVDLVIEHIYHEVLDAEVRAVLLQELDVDRRASHLMSCVAARIGRLTK